MDDVRTRLAVIHTVASLVDMFRPRLAEALPDVDVFHMLDESLLQDLLRGRPTAGIASRLASHALTAERAGASAILFTCSSTSPLIDPVRALVGIPLLKIDEPMADAAVREDGRVGVLCTTSSTEGPSTSLIRAAVERCGRAVQVEAVVVAAAFDALLAGRRDEHDRLVLDAARDLAGRCDRIVLAQASLAHLEEAIAAETTRPTFSSPRLCVSDLIERLVRRAADDGRLSAS